MRDALRIVGDGNPLGSAPLLPSHDARHGRHALRISLFAAALAWIAPAVSRAQSCHVPPPQEPLEPGLRLGITHETARFRSPRYEGHYQGLTLRGSVTRRWFFATAALPTYRIVQNGLSSRGFGDLLLYSQARLVRTENDGVAGGVALGATLPTGDERADLGMGHSMLMPGVWTTASSDKFLASAQITYARSLTSDDDHHHGSAGPLVAPMSSSELDATLSASVAIHPTLPSLRLKAGVDTAVPFVDANSVRANARVGFMLGTRVRTSLELHWPIAGEPSIQRLLLELSVALD